MISVKRHASGGNILVAACDMDLLGRKFEEGELRLDVKKDFYDGEKVDEATFLELAAIANIMNLVGKKVVGLAISSGIVDAGCVINIEGIPHAQVLRL
jgi:hypothetical protein